MQNTERNLAVFVRLLNTKLVLWPPLTPRMAVNDNTDQTSLIFILHLCDLTAIPPIKSLMGAVTEVMRHLLMLSDPHVPTLPYAHR